MESMLTVQEASDLLRASNVDHSDQMIRRWLRQGKIKGTRSANRKEGWRIPFSEIDYIIESQQYIGTPYEDGIDENTIILRFNKQIEELETVISELNSENYELRRKLGMDDGLTF
jgi:excisionase family DNA binding protein